MRDLRIAFLLDSGPSNWKGPEEFHFRLCRAIAEYGTTPVLVYSGNVADGVVARLLDSGAEVITEAGLQGIGHYNRVLGATFERFGTNVVHIRYYLYFSILPWLLRTHALRKIVYTEAGSDLAAKRAWWSWKRQLIWARTRLATWPLQRFIAISDFVRERAIQLGVNPSIIQVVHNGIDVDHFAPNARLRSDWRREQGVEDHEVVISSVNRLAPEKDVATVIQAFVQLLARGVPARLFVAGEGTLREELQALGRHLGVASRVQWLGHLNDTLPLYQGSDIFTLASLGEAFGFVLAEAMACGVPCVGSESGGIGEVIQDGCTGLLATPRNPSSFADAYERLARDRDLRHKMGQESVVRARHLFSVDRAVNETLAVYEEMLG